MTKRFRLLTMAALLVLPLAACDEGGTVAPVGNGSVTGTVTVDGTGQAGVTVTLSSGKSATTSSTGQYTITEVPTGAYTVTISGAPADVAFPSMTQAAVVTNAGEVVTVNFGGSRIRTSSIIGSVTSTGGVGLNGVTVTVTGPETKTTTTSGTGQFSFTALRAGTYSVTMTQPTGQTCATPTQSQTVAAGESKVANFTCTANTPPTTGNGTISGVLFTDSNSNGVQDAGEPTLNLSGVLVRLEGPTIGVVDNTQTVDGRFTFTNKPAGTYNVSVDPANTTFSNAGVVSTGVTTRSVTLTAGGTATANFGFIATQQRINVYAFMGRDANAAPTISTSIGTDVRPAQGVVIALYADENSALLAGTAGRLGVDTTDARGETQFSFLRSADTGPGSTADQIVFAQYLSNPSGYVLNGESRIEIRYDAARQPDMAADTFDLLNPTTLVKLDVYGNTTARPPLAGWNVEVAQNDTTGATTVTPTNAQGRADFNLFVPINLLPDTFYFRLSSAQANAAGHAFTASNAGEQGAVVGRWLRYVVSGTTRNTDTIDVGDALVRFNDTNVLVRVHHEADDSINPRPLLTAGDNFDGVENIAVSLRYTDANGVVQTRAEQQLAVGQDYLIFPNVPVGRAPYTVMARSTVANQFVLEEDTLFTVGQNDLGDLSGGSIETILCPLGKTRTKPACSTFAHKYQDGMITVNVRDTTGTVNADSVKIRVRSDPRTIQPRPTDTVLTVSRGGVGGQVTLTGVRDGFYIVSPLHDSISATGDTVWAFSGNNASTTVDVTGPAGNATVNLVARRGDTQIQGFVVNDRDADSNTVDPGEGLAGVTLSVYRDNSGTVTLDTLVKTVTTDANGAYSVTGLREGRYVVKASSPAGTVVLRRYTGLGAVVDTAVVTTTATAAASCQIANNLRRVGSSDQSCYSAGTPLPRWDYTTSTALNVNPASFTFLNNTGTAQGFIKTAGGTAVAGMTVTLRRCLTSAAPATPAAGICGSYDTSFASVSTQTDATGRYAFTGLREAVYESTPNPATVTGFSSTTPTAMLLTLNTANDVETASFTANP